MSKIYFAKYLAKDAVIRQGDKIFGKHTGNILPVTLTPTMAEKANTLGHKKAVLFICSSKIEPGDIFNVEPSWHGLKAEKVDSKGVWAFNQGDADVVLFKWDRNPYKIIGELSPKATWVEQGDKFHKNEISVTAHPQCPCGQYSDLHCKRKDLCSINEKTIFVYIKCPVCKNPH